MRFRQKIVVPPTAAVKFVVVDEPAFGEDEPSTRDPFQALFCERHMDPVEKAGSARSRQDRRLRITQVRRHDADWSRYFVKRFATCGKSRQPRRTHLTDARALELRRTLQLDA